MLLDHGNPSELELSCVLETYMGQILFKKSQQQNHPDLLIFHSMN